MATLYNVLLPLDCAIDYFLLLYYLIQDLLEFYLKGLDFFYTVITNRTQCTEKTCIVGKNEENVKITK